MSEFRPYRDTVARRIVARRIVARGTVAASTGAASTGAPGGPPIARKEGHSFVTSTPRWTRPVTTPPRDAMWRGTRTVIMFAGMRAPSAPALRDTLRELARIAPRHRAFLTTSVGPKPGLAQVGQHQLVEHCDQMVIAEPGPAPDPDELLARLHGDHDPARPLTFTVGDDFVAVASDHMVGDGRTMTTWLAELWDCALTGASPVGLAHRNIPFPLAFGLARAVCADPRGPAGALRTLREQRARSAEEPAAATGSSPWRPGVAAVSGASHDGALAELRAWRAAHVPGASVAALIFAAARAATDAEGLTLARPGFGMLVDNRRYLGRGVRFDGNLSSGLYVAPARPADPESVGAALNETLSNARPLIAMTVSALLAAAHRGGVDGAPTEIPQPARPLLNLNYLGRLTPFEHLPGGSGPTARMHMLVTPWEPTYVTYCLSEQAGRLQVTAAFHDTVFARATMEHIVTRLCADPVALLEQREPARV